MKIFNRLFTLRISDNHLFYKYDLYIRLWFIHILIMWKPTHNNTREIERYCSFSVFRRVNYNTMLKIHIGKIKNPKYIVL